MAHIARLGELAQGLVTSTTGRTDDSTSKTLKDQVLKGFKDHSHARTNQFEIRDKLSGLSEKFSVLNREDLSDALQVRLEELPHTSRWLPEILSLLLQLSDRPVEKTNLEELEALTKPALPPTLTWEELGTEDPADEDGLWTDVERGYHSSGDDVNADDEDGSEPTNSTAATSVSEEDPVAIARLQTIHINHGTLDDVHAARKDMGREDDSSQDKSVSELVLIRESLLMLHGLPTNVYIMNPSSGKTTPCKISIDTATETTIDNVLGQFAETGTQINYLRVWCRGAQAIAYLQSVQAALQRLLTNFAFGLGRLEQMFARPTHETVVSITEVRMHAEALARPLLRLSKLVDRPSELKDGPSSAVLDILYQGACAAHISDAGLVFTVVTTVFLAGLDTYLRPARAWMQRGSLATIRDEGFFVIEKDPDCELSRVWHDRYTLSTLADGTPCAPAFMQPFLSMIFSTGKTRAFLKLLAPLSGELSTSQHHRVHGQTLDPANILALLDSNPLLPFQQLVEEALESWMRDAGMDCTPLVRSSLFHEHGLTKTIRNLEFVFFGKDGTVFQTFADRLFERIHRQGASWRDQFILTELAQNTLGLAPDVDADSVTVSTSREGNSTPRSVTKQLEDLELHYFLSWPVQNITRSATLPVHSAVFVLLMQIYHAKRILRCEVFVLRTFDRKTEELSLYITTILKLHWRLMWFVDTLHSHITDTAKILHKAMRTDIEAADSIDIMAWTWANYAKRLPIALLLASNLRPIKDAVVNILEKCERSSELWKQVVTTPHEWSSSSPTATTQHGAVDPTPLVEDFNRALSFVTAGLRSVSRAGGESMLETLAERLEWHGS
ncbi:hypothetical protein LTR08_007378 [Meristemomyces frigidus]|nr:hypothetical protein LTR08_007378 [Meristemomyces frigidus]